MSRTSKAAPKDQEEPTLIELDQTFAFVCRNFLGFKDDSPSTLALRENYILNFEMLMAQSEEELEQLTYTPVGTKTTLPLMKAFSSTLKRLREWNFYLMSEYDDRPLTEEEWRGIDKGEYSTFLMRFQIGRITLAPPPPPPMPKAVDLVAEFKKGIKRDASLYPVLKDQRHWNNWQRSVLAQAHAHDIQEVFDTEYYPLGDEQEKLFSEKNKFAYAVLNRVVQTNEGKAFVWRHEKDNDAQAVYRKLVNFATKSRAEYDDVS